MSKKPEIERKFLIAMPDEAMLAAIPGATCDELVQTYLVSEAGVTARVRRRTTAHGVVYTATQKRRITAVTAIEEEREVDEAEYRRLLTLADPALHPIEKRRYSIPYGALVAEIDVYPFWQGTAILEIELASEDAPCPLPPYLSVIREVTADKRYKNVSLARAVPAE